jgi:hypothetical protein
MPIIKKPSDHFNPVLYTGVNPSAATVTTGFEPGFVWIKSRTQTYSHYLYNSVLGGGRWLYSNGTNVEDTSGDAITFSSTGFTTTASAGATNEAGQGADNLISWTWRTASSNTTNTNGAITSIVRANQTAGFSVVTYTGAGTGAGTVGHGLGAAPKFIICKSRTTTNDWVVWHSSFTSSQYILLNGTGSTQSISNYWGSSVPTSSVFGVYTGDNIPNNNYLNASMIAFCWAEVEGFSRFGTYTGNGSADGPFVYCGFKPAFVLIKNTTGNNWTIVDNKRDASNVAKRRLFPGANATEDSGANNVDMLSNGFKLRISGASDAGANQNATTFIYAAFAESPFKYATAR